ncbi:MAG: DNA replication/repair protein RecF [Xanthomonadales bacterium]|nr:DNA replication/repair protein RecF [Xanthomonadales bacterium]
MRVKSLSIINLRNISSTHLDFDPCLNCFIGDNGAGKTSILEGLCVLSKGRSFRTGQISSIIGPDGHNFQVVSKIESHSGIPHQLGMERDANSWSARHNGENITQLSELTKLLPYVLLEPNSHTLVSGPPDGRRKYLDWGVFHVEHTFLMLWRRYSRVLKQRNAALKQANRMVVESLDDQFIQLGEQLHIAREKHVSLLNSILHDQLSNFCETLEDISLGYKKGWTGDSLAEAILLSMSRDIERGSTGPGPHKADLNFTLNGVPARERLSRGEQKAMTAALIMSQAQMICNSGEKPVLMLDDLSSEFDEKHLAKVLRAGIELDTQILMTGTVLPPAIRSLNRHFTVFHVKHGSVTAMSA